MMFGAFATGQATAFGPDANKATLAAEKIFKITETPSEIDTLEEQSKMNSESSEQDEKKNISIIPQEFRGEIEFRDVWFRYPTRRN
jgi:ABC-type multidrug transport system fused ATPase/permease subunit